MAAVLSQPGNALRVHADLLQHHVNIGVVLRADFPDVPAHGKHHLRNAIQIHQPARDVPVEIRPQIGNNIHRLRIELVQKREVARRNQCTELILHTGAASDARSDAGGRRARSDDRARARRHARREPVHEGP